MDENVLSRKSVDAIQAQKIKQIFMDDPLLQTAKNVLIQSLFSKGIKIKRKSYRPKKDFVKYLKKYADPFLIQCIENILCYGYVVAAVVTNKKKEGNLIYPEHVPENFYSVVGVVKKNFAQEWEVEINNTFQEEADDDDIYLYLEPTQKPNITTGRIQSSLAPLVADSEFMNQVYDAAIEAFSQRAHPPVVLERHPDAYKNIQSMDVEMGDAILYNLEETKGRKDTLKLVQGMERNDLVLKYMKPLDSGREMPKITSRTGSKRRKLYQTHEDNLYIVPDGYKMAQPQPVLPEAPDNLEMLQTSYTERALALIRIPLPIVLSVMRRAQRDNTHIDDEDVRMMTRTIKYWQAVLVEIWEDLHRKMFNEECEYELPIIPFIDSYQLYQMFDQNIIHEKALKARLMETNNLEESEICTEENKIVRAPINGSVDQITDMINARISNIKADTKLKVANAIHNKELIPYEKKEKEADAKEAEANAKALPIQAKAAMKSASQKPTAPKSAATKKK